ncbi:MAG: glycosyltransferase family 2 protein [Mucilaginibacter sp.]|uniref:glycosyltransferase family 2 protein n=1 Tax=Mucilaginibacter sp. TaxID=1882438 RepID=UPI003262F7E7
MPKISVIVPNYNHERFLKLRIESILNQTFQDFEIIILDDCSTDDSKQIIEQYRGNPKVTKIVYNQQNSGSTFKQWQAGIALAKGEWLWIAESDDYAKSDFLESLIQLTEEYHNVGIAFSNSYKIDQDRQTEALPEYITSSYKHGIIEVRERLCHYNIITNASSCIISREIAAKASKNLHKYKACGDWIFYTRILQHTNLAYSPRKLNYYRWHQSSVSFSASKSGVYVTEGVNVMDNIDYNMVEFSLREFMSLCKGWLSKIGSLGFRYRLKPTRVVLSASLKYCIAKMY